MSDNIFSLALYTHEIKAVAYSVYAYKDHEPLSLSIHSIVIYPIWKDGIEIEKEEEEEAVVARGRERVKGSPYFYLL